MTTTIIYTIGHSLDPEAFFRLLNRYQIARVVDVRSQPWSRIACFREVELARCLERRRIGYLWEGPALGGRPQGDEWYDGGRLSARRRREAPSFRAGLQRVLELAHGGRVAVMCAEENPRVCHRGFLITPELVRAGVGVRHIRADQRQLDLGFA